MSEDRIARVVSLSSVVLFDQQDPFAAINRRISIIVMSRDPEASLRYNDAPRSASQVGVVAPADAFIR